MNRSINTDDVKKIDTKYLTNRPRFPFIAFIGRSIEYILVHSWHLCSSVLLLVFLIYWFYGGWLVLSLLVLTITVLLYNYQDKILYYADEPQSSRLFVHSPRVLGLPYENHHIKTKDGVRINVVLLKQPQVRMAVVPTIIFFHGNAGNIGHRLMNAGALYNTCGCNVLLVEYRGYGKSEGMPSERGFYADAEAALEFLIGRSDIDTAKLVLFGRSLGGAVAIELASVAATSPQTPPGPGDSVCAMVVENTFTSIPHMARVIFGLAPLKWFPLWCYKNKYLNLRKISRVRCPTLFLSGLKDELIPPHMMQALFQECSAPVKRLARFENGRHNETWECPGYFDAIAHFLREVCRHGQMEPRVAATDYSQTKTPAANYSQPRMPMGDYSQPRMPMGDYSQSRMPTGVNRVASADYNQPRMVASNFSQPRMATSEYSQLQSPSLFQNGHH